MIRLSGVKKAFEPAAGGPKVDALVGFDLEVGQGEIVAILGPSGSGKTTVLKLVAGFERADAGAVEVNGAPVTTISPQRVLVQQDSALFPWLNVENNIGFGLRAQGRADAAVVADWVRRLGLDGTERRFPKELSGGMRQRVALARALAVRPEVLLLDEPFGALDAISRDTLQDVLEAAWSASRPSVILVTHSVDEALRLADRIVVVSERPARVRSILRVAAGRPRDVSAMGDLRRELTAAVRGGAAMPGEGPDDGTWRGASP